MTARLEHIPGPMPWPLRAMLEPDNAQEADTAARAVAHYAALEAAHHARAWRIPQRYRAARRHHRNAATLAARAYAAELEALAPPRRHHR